MKRCLTLFIGGPGDPLHNQMVEIATININIYEAKSFDDEQARPANINTTSWLNYLRTCDIAIFLLPYEKCGIKDPETNEFYTLIELKQAHLSGILVYLIIQQSNEDVSELAMEVKKHYKNNFTICPIELSKSKKGIITTYKNILPSSIEHWDILIKHIDLKCNEIQNLINQSGKGVDRTTASIKEWSESQPIIKAVDRYLIMCWNFRRQCPKSPELPQYLLRAFFYIVRPCMQPQDIENAVSGQATDIWNLFCNIIDQNPICSSKITNIPEVSQELFKSLSYWRQRALINFLREVAIAFRYRLDLTTEWKFAKRAFNLYKINSNIIDPENKELFNLAIGIVPSAAYSLKTSELTEIDKEDSLITILESKHSLDKNKGATQALAVYYATERNIDKAKSYLDKAIEGFKNAEMHEDNYVHSLIFFACMETGGKRRKTFKTLNEQFPNWESIAHPCYLAIANLGFKKTKMEWHDILRGVQIKKRINMKKTIKYSRKKKA